MSHLQVRASRCCCEEKNPTNAYNSSMKKWHVYLPLLAMACRFGAAAPIVLNGTVYHITLSNDPQNTCLNTRDIHQLNGTIDNNGGLLSAHVLNQTWTGSSYKISIGPRDIHSPERNITTSWVCNGKLLTITGRTYQDRTELHELMFYSRTLPKLLGILSYGPNPPPPPPPPPDCGAAHNRSSCDAVPQPVSSVGANPCIWCTSKDGSHALCFDQKNEPPSSSWTCEAPRLK